MFELITNAQANTSEISQNPLDWGIALWVLILAMTLPGGFANWVQRIGKDKYKWSWQGVLELLKDVAWSGSIGPIAFMIVIRQTDDLMLAIIANGICAHLAPRLIFGGNAIVDIGTNKYLKKIDPEAKKHQLSDDELNNLIQQAVNDAKEKP